MSTTKDGMCFAPWEDDEVKSINGYQLAGIMHPFTCINRGRDDHMDTEGIMLAEEEAMYCPFCAFLQTWVHDFMADWSWQKKFFNLKALRSGAKKA